MSERSEKLARGIRSFVENPATSLVKGVVLLLIGISDASHTLRDDLTHGHVRVDHGLIIIGPFGILGALPDLINGLGAAARYFESRSREDRAKRGMPGR